MLSTTWKNLATAESSAATNPRFSKTIPGPHRLPTPASTTRCASARLHFRQQLVDREFLKILRVEPLEFCAVEDAVGPAYVFERKFLQQVLRAQKFLVVARRPTEQRK